MFAALFSWLASGGLAAIGRELRVAHEAKLRAANDSERIAADVRIRELEARQASILAAQGDRFERWVRIAFAAPFVAYLWKLVIFDKVLGLGVTDPLSPMLTEVMWIVIGGYFLVSAARIIRK
jgi:hypothetical protein